jgi:hypothetical protein
MARYRTGLKKKMQKRNETFLTEQEEKQRRETPHKKLLSLSLPLHHLLKPEKKKEKKGAISSVS